jgi:hypothetical protein
LGKVSWPGTVLAELVKVTELLEVTLVEMASGSPSLRDLFGSPDSRVPCLSISGDTFQILSVPEAEAARLSKLSQLLRRLWLDNAKYESADLLFGGSNNNIVVSVASMRYLSVVC